MRQVICPKIGSEHFTYVKDESGFGGVFTIEMSTLQALGGIRKVWDDESVDAGFVMISKKTGKEAVFTCTRIKYDGGQETVFWELAPVFSSYNQPGCRELQYVTVKVFNT